MDVNWSYEVTEKIRPHLGVAEYSVIMTELEFQTSHNLEKLPQGLIHGDLFKDNVLFFDDKLTGILDFYNACHDSLLLDLAIMVNDWSHDATGHINQEKFNCLLQSYQQVRPLTAVELEMWPVMLRIAALRFWLCRLEHKLFQRSGDLIQEKDPIVYWHILRQHQAAE